VTVPLTGDGLGDAELVVVLLLPQAARRSMAPAAMLGKRKRLKVQLPSK
jgi:hypothetical protein